MKQGNPHGGPREWFRLATERLEQVNKWFLAAGMAAFVAVLLTVGFAERHRVSHPVVGPAGGAGVRASASITIGSPATQEGPHKRIKKVTVVSGDTLLGILADAGVAAADANNLLEALSSLFGPSDLQPGQTIALSFTGGPAGANERLSDVQIGVDSTRDIVATVVAPGEFTAQIVPQKVVYRPALVSGKVSTTLYEAAQAAGLPVSVLMDMIRAYSFDVDFQRDVHPGDVFSVIFNRVFDSSGRFLSDGNMVFAALSLAGVQREIYEYRTARGYVDYFDGSGQSVRKMLMRTPVQGAWISSVFGWRKNPINGYSEFHRGLDFAVPPYTPIMAAGNGTVVVVGRDQDYGNYVQLRHANGYETLYAHMIAFARGIQAGAVVSQGDVIGYVGTTGMSTGPHLHYEVIYQGVRINPANVVSPMGPVLTGVELRSFLSAKERVDQEYADLTGGSPIPAHQDGVAAHPHASANGSQG